MVLCRRQLLTMKHLDGCFVDLSVAHLSFLLLVYLTGVKQIVPMIIGCLHE